MDLDMVAYADSPVVPASKKHKQVQDTLPSDEGNSFTAAGSSIKPKSIDHIDDSGSDFSNHVDEDDHDADCFCDYDDYDNFSYEKDEYDTLQSQFDNVDLPTGVEISLPWLKDPSPSENIPSTRKFTISDSSNTKGKEVASCSTIQAELDSSNQVGDSEDTVIQAFQNFKQFDVVDIPSTRKFTIFDSSNTKGKEVASCSTIQAELDSSNQVGDSEDTVMQAFQNFKKFDVVADFSDHHFNRLGFVEKQARKSWTKRVQEEWKILEKDLPETIFVRVYESRMDLLRAVLVGPDGTPYHDGLFVFDCLFPTEYPFSPPIVYYYSGGLRLNPNLYECGKVCLSLLGTWSGHHNENWVPGQSTMLQVLVSIQALILNAKPFFNEPGYENSFTGAVGESESNKYNNDVYIRSLKTMVYTLRRPPKHFEDLVVCHFRNQAHDILLACQAYMDGALVGSNIKDAQGQARSKASVEFKAAVGQMRNMLITSFTRNGSTDCEQFRLAA